MAELLDIYDADGNKTGEVIERGEPYKEGQYHLASNVWIINDNLEILIQKRSAFKENMPNIWATHGGCAATGETSLKACIREANEEIGINLKAENLSFLARMMGDHLIMDNYVIMQNYNISDAKLQEEEVSKIKWVSLEKLIQMIKDKECFDYPEMPYLIQFIRDKQINRQH